MENPNEYIHNPELDILNDVRNDVFSDFDNQDVIDGAQLIKNELEENKLSTSFIITASGKKDDIENLKVYLSEILGEIISLNDFNSSNSWIQESAKRHQLIETYDVDNSDSRLTAILRFDGNYHSNLTNFIRTIGGNNLKGVIQFKTYSGNSLIKWDSYEIN